MNCQKHRVTINRNPSGVAINCNPVFPANGTLQVVFDMRSTRFRPGKLPLKLNPCCMYKLETSTTCQDIIQVGPYYPWNPNWIYAVQVKGDWLSHVVNTTHTWPNYPSEIEEDLSNWLLAKTRAAGNSGAISVPVSLGELPETIGMILGPAGKLVRATETASKRVQKLYNLHKLKSRHGPIRQLLHDASDLSKTRTKYEPLLGKTIGGFISGLTDIYLAYTYGIAPLAQEVDTYCDLAAGQVVRACNEENYRIDRASKRTTVSKTRSSKRYTARSSDGWFMVNMVDDVSTSIVATGHAYYQRRNTASDTWYETLGLHQPLSALWEIVPGSFILDWVLNIGLFLNNLEVNPLQTLVGQCMTLKTEIQTSQCAVGGYRIDSGTTANLRGQRMTTEHRLVRQPIPASETAVKLTPYGVGSRLNQNLSLAALSWQQLSNYMK